MNYPDTSNAWAFADAKSAAVYFEKAHFVAPAWTGDNSEIRSLAEVAQVAIDPLVTFASPGLFIVGEAAIGMQDAMVREFFAIQGEPVPSFQLPEPAGHDVKVILSATWTTLLAVKAGVSGPGCFILPQFAVPDDPDGEPSLLLSNLSLVDTALLSWDHILDIREDEKAHRKLRRLRLFLYEEHRNKDPSFVRDDLLQRIDDYQSAAKAMGVEMKEGALSAIFSKDATLSAAVSLAALLSGHPVVALSAAVPLLAQLGKVSLELRGRRRSLLADLDCDPVAFLADLSCGVKEIRGRDVR